MEESGVQELEAAARWHLRLEESPDDAALQRRFHKWLERDPRHVAAFDDVVRSLAGIDGQENAAWLAADANATSEKLRRRQRATSRAMAAGLLVIAVLSAGALFSGPPPVSRTFAATDEGIRTIRLADRSEIVLDRRSVVRVAFTDQLRRIELVEGQAQFVVAHDASRPFEVMVDRRVVAATGTDFIVDRAAGRLSVALLSGGVEVSVEPDCPDRMAALCTYLRRDRQMLAPGESLSGSLESGDLVRARVSPADASAWKVGLLIAKDEELESVVKRLNRYAGGKTITIGNPGLGKMRVDGAFRIGNPGAVAEVLEQLLDIEADTKIDGSVVLREK